MGDDFYFSEDELANAFKILQNMRDRIPGQDMIRFKSFFEGFKYALTADDQLRESAGKFHYYKQHQLWECQSDDFKLLMAEPKLGCSSPSCEDAWNRWVAKCRNSGVKKREDALDEEYKKLNSMFDENKERLGIRAVDLRGWKRNADVS